MNQALNDFYKQLNGKTVAVVGIGVSNTPLCKMLIEKGAIVTACDRREQKALGDICDTLIEMGVLLQLGEDYLENLFQDMIIKTPGLRFDVPRILQAQVRGSKITSEMELFFDLCPCKIIAVTGSDGKSTTTTLIYEMLKNQGVRCHLGGNIGQPLLPQIEEILENDVVVAELSSFQLHTMKKSPHIAVITNVAPNHLDMHKSMEEYVDAKCNIMRYQSADDILILNQDNEITRELSKKAKGKVLLFSRKTKVKDGAYVKDGILYRAENGQSTPFMNESDILLPGKHNVENYMAALLAVDLFATKKAILHTARTFQGLQHRLELVRELSGVCYYNDSIASSPTRTKACFASFDRKLILIAGGYDKHIPFDQFGEELTKHVKYLALIGVTAPAIRKAAENSSHFSESGLVIEDCATLEEAVFKSKAHAESGDIVVLSPACASFDMFQNFEVRGNTFKKIVNEL